MYTTYYGFREKPFALSPDPRFLFLSASHREVLGHLVYGIEQGDGFMAITGEVGTGKTTLCRTLLRRLGNECEVAFLFNPTLTPLELLKAVNSEFGLSTFGDSRPELTDVLNAFLLEMSAEGRRVLLIVDEAQNLSIETLEQLRLLSNLETETSKLLQIVLLGQPELDQKLDAKELRQLGQRISVWWRLGPLDAGETCEYVRHRLRIAGALERPIFTDAALRTVYRLSRGVPRVINLLCDRALLAGYADQKAQIGRSLVLRVAMELRPGWPRRPWRRAWVGATAGVVALLGGGLLILGIAPSLRDTREASRSDAAEAATATPTPVVETEAGAAPLVAAVSAPAPEVGESWDGEAVSAPQATLAYGVLDSLLPLRSPAESHAATLDAALVAWRLPATGASELSIAELRERLEGGRLELLSIPPELPELLRTSAPAIVSLRDAHGVTRLALLRALSAHHADLEGVVQGATLRISTADLLSHLDGEVYAVWRDYEGLPPVLRSGDRGEPVAWLQRALAELGYYGEEAHGLFDDATREAVASFQGDRGIRADGEVGPLTQIRLYDALPRYATPTLASGTVDFTDAS